MPREQMSATAVQAAMAQETDEAFIMLLTVMHDDLAAPMRFCQDDVAEETRIIDGDEVLGITSRGDFYAAFPFAVDIPADKDDEIARVQLTIDNVSQKIIATLRTLVSPPTVSLEIALLDSPDTVEAGPYEMKLKSAPYNTLQITGELGGEDILNEPYPGERFTPSNAPGLW
ncbi:MAG: DUF1833 family protein [Desulfovibrionaceae bacterium]